MIRVATLWCLTTSITAFVCCRPWVVFLWRSLDTAVSLHSYFVPVFVPQWCHRVRWAATAPPAPRVLPVASAPRVCGLANLHFARSALGLCLSVARVCLADFPLRIVPSLVRCYGPIAVSSWVCLSNLSHLAVAVSSRLLFAGQRHGVRTVCHGRLCGQPGRHGLRTVSNWHLFACRGSFSLFYLAGCQQQQ